MNTIIGLIIAFIPLLMVIGFVSKILKKVNESKLKAKASGDKKIFYVIDGDTVIINDNIKVRIADIDAPEINQEGGENAKIFLSKTIAKKTVIIKTKDIDVYGRVVATIIKDGKDIGLFMLENGQAIATRNAPSKYKKAEKFAQNQKRGIWRLKKFQNPSEWRQQNA